MPLVEVDLSRVSESLGARFRWCEGGIFKHGFAIKYQAQVYAYENRCPHLGTQLDWLPGEFMDEQRRYIICATHGALFEPATGKCVLGPCKAQCLNALDFQINGAKLMLNGYLPE